MSGVVSAAVKVFKPVVSSVAKVTSSVAKIGQTVFTAGASTLASSMSSGGLLSFAQNSGTIGSTIRGATNQAGFGQLLQSAQQTSGLTGGVNGMINAGAGAARTAGTGGGFSLGKILESPLTGNILAGVGSGLQKRAEIKAIQAENQRARDFRRQQQEQLTGNYSVNPDVFKVQSAAGATHPENRRHRDVFDPARGQIVRQTVPA